MFIIFHKNYSNILYYFYLFPKKQPVNQVPFKDKKLYSKKIKRKYYFKGPFLVPIDP